MPTILNYTAAINPFPTVAPTIDPASVDSLAIGSACTIGPSTNCISIGTSYASGTSSFSFANASNSPQQTIASPYLGTGPNGAQGTNTIVLGQGGVDTEVFDSVIAGGQLNVINGTCETSCIFGGSSNLITNSDNPNPSFASSFDTVILAGTENYIAGGSSDVIAGGILNSLTYSFGGNFISGSLNIMNKCNDSVLLGSTNTADTVSNVMGVNGAQITNSSAVVQGFSTGPVNVSPQIGSYLIYVEDEANAHTGILATSTTDVTSQLIIPNNACWYFECRVMGRNKGGLMYVADFKGRASNMGGFVTLDHVTKTIVVQDDVSWDVDVTADPATAEINFTFTTGSNYTRWMGEFKTVEMLGSNNPDSVW